MEFPENILPFFQEKNFMILGTLRHDNTIQMSVVWYMYADKLFLVSTTTDRAKYKNMTRNPNVTFLIFDAQDSYKFVQVRGTVTINKTGAHELIDTLSEKYTGNNVYQFDPDHKEDRAVIRIKPTGYVPNGF